MNWSSVTDFVHMGGYGLYVWGSFGMVAATLLAEVVQLRLRHQALVNGDEYDAQQGNNGVAHEGQN